ncbi:MAG: TonB-dependent receptor plug domain-containing protein [Asticcacaulis sp.]
MPRRLRPPRRPPTPDGDQVVQYPTSYFAEFQVSTAFDMVLHVPGFVFDGGESARGFSGSGFSGTAGNVLIDGQRPATKADLGNTLSNINSAQVDHLELITGGAPGIDMHGHRQIVNVVRKKDAKPNLSLLGIVRNMDGNNTKGVLLFTYNDNHDGKATDVTADVFTFFDNGTNRARRLTTDDTGTQVLDIHQVGGGAGMESQASHSRPLWGGKITFNGTYNPSIYRYDARYIDSQTASELLFDKDTPSELGGQYERQFSHGLDLNLNVLNRHDREHVLDTYDDDSGVSDYQSLRLNNEHILNGRLSWQKNEAWLFTLGSETAFNSLDETSSFVMNSSDQDVPTTSVRVQEDRMESFASVSWKATPKLNFEGELKVENSTISVPQDQRSDSFTYVKPRFEAVYTIDDKTKISWKTVRQVDQLSFNGFASSVQLQTNQVTLGNTALVPQKDWLNTIVLERSFWDKGAVSLALEHYNYEDTSDFIAVIDGTDVYSRQRQYRQGHGRLHPCQAGYTARQAAHTARYPQHRRDQPPDPGQGPDHRPRPADFRNRALGLPGQLQPGIPNVAHQLGHRRSGAQRGPQLPGQRTGRFPFRSVDAVLVPVQDAEKRHFQDHDQEPAEPALHPGPDRLRGLARPDAGVFQPAHDVAYPAHHRTAAEEGFLAQARL